MEFPLKSFLYKRKGLEEMRSSLPKYLRVFPVGPIYESTENRMILICCKRRPEYVVHSFVHSFIHSSTHEIVSEHLICTRDVLKTVDIGQQF